MENKFNLPDMCFTVLESNGKLVCIKLGETGYYDSEWSMSDVDQNKAIAKHMNEKLGVSYNQQQAMIIASMTHYDASNIGKILEKENKYFKDMEAIPVLFKNANGSTYSIEAFDRKADIWEVNDVENESSPFFVRGIQAYIDNGEKKYCWNYSINDLSSLEDINFIKEYTDHFQIINPNENIPYERITQLLHEALTQINSNQISITEEEIEKLYNFLDRNQYDSAMNILE